LAWPENAITAERSVFLEYNHLCIFFVWDLMRLRKSERKREIESRDKDNALGCSDNRKEIANGQ
jgi:hypothetical protein